MSAGDGGITFTDTEVTANTAVADNAYAGDLRAGSSTEVVFDGGSITDHAATGAVAIPWTAMTTRNNGATVDAGAHFAP